MADQIPTPPPSSSAAPAGSSSIPPAESPSPATPSVEQDEKFFAALGYIGPLFVMPLIVKPKSTYCKFHAKQSMVLFLIFVVFLFILGFISVMLGSLITLPLFALYVIAIYRAYQGDMWNIPVISKFAGKMNIEELYGKAGLAVGALSGLKDKAHGLAEKAGETVKTLGAQEQTPPAQPPAQEAPAAPAPQPPQTPPPTAPQTPAQ